LPGLRAPSKNEHWKNDMLLGITLFLLGIFLVFRADQIPGDLGDARFNMYVLEHGYRWLVHRDSSF
jgi:hypothetical protein